MPGLIFSKGYFPWPIVKATIWDELTWFKFAIYDDTGTSHDGDIWVPGITGPQITSGFLMTNPTSSIPNCYPDGTPVMQYIPVVGPGTFYPIGMSLESACKIYWRVRRWKVTCTWSKSYVNPTDPSADQSASNTFTQTVYNTNLDYPFNTPEGYTPIPQNLVAGYQGSFSTSRIQDNGQSPAQANINFSAFRLADYCTDREGSYIPGFGDQAAGIIGYNPLIFDSTIGVFSSGFLYIDEIVANGINSYPVAPKQNICFEETTGLYYPAIIFGGSSLSFYSGDFFLPVTPYSVKSKIQVIGGAASGPISGTLSFDESSLTFTYNASFTGSVAQPGVTVTESTVIEPELWFDYDPDDGGGPYYDTSTGEQIR